MSSRIQVISKSGFGRPEQSACLLALFLVAAAPEVNPAGEKEVDVSGFPAVVTVIPGALAVEEGPVDLNAVRAWRDRLLDAGLAVDRCGSVPRHGTFAVEVTSDAEVSALRRAGFRILDVRTGADGVGVGVRTQSQYFDPDEIELMLTQIQAAHPSITRLIDVGTTVEGRTIRGIEISNAPLVVEDEPAILFNGQHHAREVATSHVVMDVVTTLTSGYGIDQDVTSWVDAYRTVCVPMVNPDGVQHVFNGTSLWRRNRMVYPSCTGVDLNRNYPYLWGPGCGSSSSCNDLYRGPTQASELETQAMMDLADAYHFVMATSYHSYGRFIDYPYACSNGSPSGQMPEHEVIHTMMHGVSDGIFEAGGVEYDVYSPVPFGGVNGDDTSWYYADRGTYAFIIEVGTSFEPPFSQVAGIVNENRGGWKYMYERLGEARLDVHVTDACTGQPLEAEVTLTDYVYDTGESVRQAFMPHGRWTYLVMPDQSYTVRASQSGYATDELTVLVDNEPVPVDLTLIPLDLPPTGCAVGSVPTVSGWGLVVMALMTALGATLLLDGLDRRGNTPA